jgi:hypothetical protein
MTSCSPSKDLVAATAVLGAVAGELAIREIYYRLWVELPRLLLVLAVWLALLVLVQLGSKGSQRRTHILGRVAVFVGLALWIDVVGVVAIAAALGPDVGSTIALYGAYAMLLVGGLWAVRATDAAWAPMRRVAVVASVLFVACQPIVAAVRAPSVSWPDRVAAKAPNAIGRTTSVFLLLDELNARSAEPIISALSATGRKVHFKELEPAGDATRKVVPSMFTGETFLDPKPCGLHTVCSADRVLDFAKVVASRPDADLVGFYEPYCAIQGLRYCVRLTRASPALHAQRGWCAALRRSSWLASMAGADADAFCSGLGGEVWLDLAQRVEDAIWRAPIWQEGGFLYVHFPLPHPPGALKGGSLSAHYRANIERATRLVAEMMTKLDRRAQSFNIVVFSDHPLRPVWCESTQYENNGCPLGADLVDSKVPLIVLGDVPAAFARVRSNADIFLLSQ